MKDAEAPEKQYVVIDQSNPADEWQGCYNTLNEAKDQAFLISKYAMVFEMVRGKPFIIDGLPCFKAWFQDQGRWIEEAKEVSDNDEGRVDCTQDGA